ncbi:ATP-binding protein, partial [Spirulina sp. 06S082]|uniref:ATP-binding protein n=1 Tax=Spirulina sp. 06S082 TaxID=3110248 RepID=UPI002B20065D
MQRLYDSDPLDDIIVISDLKCGEAKLALQVKRDLSFGEKNQKFDEVMEACWSTFKSSDFRIGIDRFGLVVALYSKNINEYYQTVLTWARNSIDSQDFLKRINTEGFSNKTQRSFINLIRTKLSKHSKTPITDNDLWDFLRSMVILHFDFQQEGARDYTYAVETISHLLPPNKKTDAPKLFEKLVNYATNGSKTAGSFNLERLTEKLLSDDFDILPSPDCRNDLARLEEHADFILNNIQNTIGNFNLDRSNLISKIKKIRERASFIEIIGAPGVGKSAILKELIEDDRQQGFSLVFSGDRISGASWSSFASHLQIEQPLQKILLAASSVAQPTIFIDGIDRIIDSGHQNVINDLIRILQTIKLDWKIIVSMREENRMQVYQWLNWQPFGKPEQIHIPELTHNELRETIGNNDFLKPLLSLTHNEPIIKNLFILSLLKKQEMMFDLENLSPISTEIEFEKWW